MYPFSSEIGNVIAENGIEVFCVEPSPAMRREFDNKLKRCSALADKITLVEGDVWSFSIGRRFPTAILSGCFDHFLDDHERMSALENIHRHLIPKGVLVFDVFLGLMEESNLHPSGSVINGGIEYRRHIATRRLSRDTLTVTILYEIYEDGVLIDRLAEESEVGVVERDGIQRLLSESGFAVQREFGNYDSSEYKNGDSLLIIEAARTDVS